MREIILRIFFLVASHINDAVNVVPAPQQGIDGAYLDCPCKVDASLTAPEADRLQISIDYGSARCRAWEFEQKIQRFASCYDTADPPRCGTQKWCYVDREVCNRTYVRSDIFNDRWLSYETCGYQDFFSPYEQWDEMRTASGVQVGVFIPGLELSKDPRPKNRQGELDTYSRAYLKFGYHIATLMNISDSLVHQELSNASRAAYPSSSYSACVHDISLGNLDMCVGGMWYTNQRVSMRGVRFTLVSHTDAVLVVPLKTDEDTFLDKLYRPFKNFSVSAWAMLFGAMFASGIALGFFENGVPAYIQFWKLSEHRVSALFHAAADLLTSFFTASHDHQATSLSGRIIALGIAVFLCITLARFTAIATSDLVVVRTQNAEVKTLSEAITKQYKVCLLNSMKPNLLPTHPELDYLGTIVDTVSDIEPALKARKCMVAVMDRQSFLSQQANGHMCDYRAVEKTVDVTYVGFYTASWISQAVAARVANARASGEWAMLETELLTPGICGVPDEKLTQESNNGELQLGPEDLIGEVGIIVITILLATFTKLWQVMYRKCEQIARQSSISQKNTQAATRSTSTLPMDATGTDHFNKAAGEPEISQSQMMAKVVEELATMNAIQNDMYSAMKSEAGSVQNLIAEVERIRTESESQHNLAQGSADGDRIQQRRTESLHNLSQKSGDEDRIERSGTKSQYYLVQESAEEAKIQTMAPYQTSVNRGIHSEANPPPKMFLENGIQPRGIHSEQNPPPKMSLENRMQPRGIHSEQNPSSTINASVLLGPVFENQSSITRARLQKLATKHGTKLGKEQVYLRNLSNRSRVTKELRESEDMCV